MRTSIFIAGLFFYSPIALAQPAPAIDWQKALGGTLSDNAESLDNTNDGGYIVTGLCYSSNGNVSGSQGYYDMWVVKLASDGSLQWQKSLGGTDGDSGFLIRQTNDLGYISVGGTTSNNGDVIGNHGSSDAWVVKMDASGNIEWQRCLGGSSAEGANSVLQLADGGYLIAATTQSNDGDVTDNHGSFDAWLVRLDASGTIIWQRTYGGSAFDLVNAVVEAGDGGFVVAGATNSIDGDVAGYQGGENDYWIFKVDGNGQLLWQKTCGGTGYDRAVDLARTSDGGFVVTGNATSVNGDVSGAHGDTDNWVVKLNGSGDIQWQRPLGGTLLDYGESIIEVDNGDIVVAGGSSSLDGDVSMNHGGQDAWVVRLSELGVVRWTKCMGGTAGDAASQILRTNDGGYALAGIAISNNGDVSGNHGASDYWVVKLALDPTAVPELLDQLGAFVLWPNPTTSDLHILFDQHTPIHLSVEVYDYSGKRVRSIEHLFLGLERSLSLNTALFAPGTYTVRVFSSRTQASRLFIKL